MIYEIIKGSEKDFEGAPEGALLKIKHIDVDCAVFAEEFKYGAKFWYDSGIEGELNGYYTHGIVIAERKLVDEHEWNGEGFPPVGLDCEIYFPEDTTPRWKPATLLYSSDMYTIAYIAGHERSYYTREFKKSKVIFRKKLTKEETEKELSVSQMAEFMIGSVHDVSVSARKLYDAIVEGKIKSLKLDK